MYMAKQFVEGGLSECVLALGTLGTFGGLGLSLWLLVCLLNFASQMRGGLAEARWFYCSGHRGVLHA